MQNVVLFREPNDDTFLTPTKVGDLFFNRFGIDEDAAFEMLGVYQLQESSWKMTNPEEEEYKNFDKNREAKG